MLLTLLLALIDFSHHTPTRRMPSSTSVPSMNRFFQRFPFATVRLFCAFVASVCTYVCAHKYSLDAVVRSMLPQIGWCSLRQTQAYSHMCKHASHRHMQAHERAPAAALLAHTSTLIAHANTHPTAATMQATGRSMQTQKHATQTRTQPPRFTTEA